MKLHSKTAISYMFRNFWKLVYVTLPASALLALFYNPAKELQLFGMLVAGQLTMDDYTYWVGNSLTVLRFGNTWWATLISLVVFAFAMSIMIVKLDRHMRMGVMPALPLRRAFGIFPIMLAYILCWLVTVEVFALVAVGISYMAKFLGSVTAIVSLTIALSFVFKAIIAYMFVLLLISFPLKYSENYRFNRALSYSARIMFPKKRLLLGIALAYPFARAIVMALGYLLAPYHLDLLVYGVGVLFATTFVPCFAFKHYYDDVGGERRDLPRSIFG